MEDRVKVTVIVATYKDKPEHLKRTIKSITTQTFKNWELVIVDGAECGVKSDKNIKVIKAPAKGISDAFNKGVESATGDYLYFIGASDYLWDKTVLEKMMEGIEDEMLVCGRINRVSEDGKIRYTSSLNFSKWKLIYKMGLPHQGLFTHRKFFKKYGMFDVSCKYSMDYELLLRAHKSWPGVVMKDVVVAAWVEGGIGKDRTEEVLEEYRKIRIENRIASVLGIEMIIWASKLWAKIK